jgi:N-acetylmuramoyl-L-alanine amidase
MDIPYNFLIGDDGNVYEGRGFHFQGEHTANANGTSYDGIGICVAFIGNFEGEEPSDLQLETFKRFIKFNVNVGIISTDHKIFSQDQLTKPIVPASALFDTIKSWEHFYSGLRLIASLPH